MNTSDRRKNIFHRFARLFRHAWHGDLHEHPFLLPPKSRLDILKIRFCPRPPDKPRKKDPSTGFNQNPHGGKGILAGYI